MFREESKTPEQVPTTSTTVTNSPNDYINLEEETNDGEYQTVEDQDQLEESQEDQVQAQAQTKVLSKTSLQSLSAIARKRKMDLRFVAILKDKPEGTVEIDKKHFISIENWQKRLLMKYTVRI